jgi:HPt (histidine-containing phosphotransfer) domain-containing protein
MTTRPSEAPAAPPFDADDLLDRTCGDRDLLTEVIDIFRSDTPGQLATLQLAVATDDLGGVERAAHRLRGSLSSLSARPAADAALALEAFARAGARAELAGSLLHLELEVERLDTALTAYQHESS